MDFRTLCAPNLPGSEHLSQQIFKSRWVMDLILSMVLVATTSDYYCADSYFANGTNCDILLKSKDDDGCPVMVEIQDAVTSTWIRDKLLLDYCNQIIRSTGKVPIVIVFPIHPLSEDLNEVFDKEQEHWFAHQITVKILAKKLYIVDPATIRNATIDPLPPIAALAVFLADQKRSFFESDYHNEPTFRKLYDLAFEICEKGGLKTGIMGRYSAQKQLIKKVTQLVDANDGSLNDYLVQMHDLLSAMP
ncbi:hypothetical protein [Absidia glauca]|uniref:Uncharacterized protein n=1 Tax=Absidia glauca TaxID=4829 RepID=A0A163TCN8_ABSGL|nr:hypothetical protein [Absidia glauca]